MKKIPCSINLKYKFGKALVADLNDPNQIVGYQETDVRDLFKKYNLKIIDPIYYGSWYGRKEALEGQDMFIATKTS